MPSCWPRSRCLLCRDMHQSVSLSYTDTIGGGKGKHTSIAKCTHTGRGVAHAPTAATWDTIRPVTRHQSGHCTDYWFAPINPQSLHLFLGQEIPSPPPSRLKPGTILTYSPLPPPFSYLTWTGNQANYDTRQDTHNLQIVCSRCSGDHRKSACVPTGKGSLPSSVAVAKRDLVYRAWSSRPNSALSREVNYCRKRLS